MSTTPARGPLFSLERFLPQSFSRPPLRLVARTAERILGLHRLESLYNKARTRQSGDFAADVLAAANISYHVCDRDLNRIPANGPVVIVANHPYGGLEGLVLANLVRQIRPDIRVMANSMLGNVDELRDLFILVNPFGGVDASRENSTSLRSALSWISSGGVLIVFPAGEVSSMTWNRREVRDREWSPTIARILQATKATVVPAYIVGVNGPIFQAAGLIHSRLRTALLPRQLTNKAGARVEVRIGRPLSSKRVDEYRSPAELIAYLRVRTYTLEHRATRDDSDDDRHVQMTPVAQPTLQADLAYDMSRLNVSQRLIASDDLEVWHARAKEIPSIVREIGRLRETTFRASGEGSGAALDLDRFDAYYRHLFIWNRSTCEVVGAYRLGLVDEIVERFGRTGLYSSTLFHFPDELLERIGPAIEMGRAFVRAEHQKSFAPLLLLWRGICAFIEQHPRYATLFGPLSLSADYAPASRTILTQYLERTALHEEYASMVRPRSPWRPRRFTHYDEHAFARLMRDMEELSWTVNDIEADDKGVPVLMRQYLKLGARLLSLNVDESFGGCIDGLILVDLTKTDPAMLSRYMGRDQTMAFRAFHGVLDDTSLKAA
ncbi:MAG: lysophospholipid acyltransferase family protein [bacterium]|nr:lysophospholipid acyltransferase family protein [Candidatus Kapabacteria bacterium]